MNKIAYKVVKAWDGNYFSAMSSRLPDIFCLNYELNKTTYPTMGKIFVFDTLKDAKNFIVNCTDYGYYIFEGTATNVGFPTMLSYDIESERYLQKFWKLKKEKKPIPHSSRRNAPNGTMTCDSFTPNRIMQ